jgi:bifunctional NMN adenylyltransferase/nudix hydrolase
MKIGIIVARFQTSYLHEAHKKLIEHVKSKNDFVFAFIGTVDPRLTIPDPLDYESRKIMVQTDYPFVDCYKLPNRKYDEHWCALLDSYILQLGVDGHDVTLYASREGFINSYTGKFKTEFVSEIITESISATEIRKQIHSQPITCQKGREGVIWASAHKYPISYQTVDVAILNSDSTKILLGKKENEFKFRFIGGFVDPADSSLENSAFREAEEETGIKTAGHKYICSARIDDWRYRSASDKIMTSFFVCEAISGEAKPNDDINKLEWFDVSKLNADLFEDEHFILYNALKRHLEKIEWRKLKTENAFRDFNQKLDKNEM